MKHSQYPMMFIIPLRTRCDEPFQLENKAGGAAVAVAAPPQVDFHLGVSVVDACLPEVQAFEFLLLLGSDPAEAVLDHQIVPCLVTFSSPDFHLRPSFVLATFIRSGRGFRQSRC